MSQRINYRTPDGIIHHWTEAEIDKHLKSMNVVVSEVSTGPQEEAVLTIEMLHNLLPYRGTSYKAVSQATKDELLERIGRMQEPLKEMVQSLEVKP